MISPNEASQDAYDGKHVLAIEVEEYFQASVYEDLLLPAEWDSLPGRVESCIEEFLRLLERHGTSATFFISQWVAERYPELVARIGDRGHEIGLLWRNDDGSAEEKEQFRRQVSSVKALLEGLAHLTVAGFRARRCCLPYEEDWVYDVLISQGFVYDSSVCPTGRADRSTGEGRWPHSVESDNGSLLEVPRPSIPVLGRYVRTASGPRLRQLPYRVTASTIDRYSQHSQPAIISIRSWEIDHHHPRISGASWQQFSYRLGLRRTLPILKRLLTEFEFSSAREVLPLHSAPELTLRRGAAGRRAADEGRGT